MAQWHDKFHELRTFFQVLLTSPGAMGAIYPSSKSLANKMAAQIPNTLSDIVVEIGPGTGTITRALLDSGIQAEKLIIIERSEAMVNYLHAQFNDLQIIHGDAKHIKQLVNNQSVSCIVSSLPLKSLQAKDAEEIIAAIYATLIPDGIYIQYGYKFFREKLNLEQHFNLIHSKHVWFNLPPARVDVYQKNGGASL